MDFPPTDLPPDDFGLSVAILGGGYILGCGDILGGGDILSSSRTPHGAVIGARLGTNKVLAGEESCEPKTTKQKALLPLSIRYGNHRQPVS